MAATASLHPGRIFKPLSRACCTKNHLAEPRVLKAADYLSRRSSDFMFYVFGLRSRTDKPILVKGDIPTTVLKCAVSRPRPTSRFGRKYRTGLCAAKTERHRPLAVRRPAAPLSSAWRCCSVPWREALHPRSRQSVAALRSLPHRPLRRGRRNRRPDRPEALRRRTHRRGRATTTATTSKRRSRRHRSCGGSGIAPAPDPPGLLTRAQADYKRILAALYNEARYDATISITLNGREVGKHSGRDRAPR